MTDHDRAVAARDATQFVLDQLTGDVVTRAWIETCSPDFRYGAHRAYTIARDAVAAELHRLNCEVAAGERDTEPWRPQAGRRLGRTGVVR